LKERSSESKKQFIRPAIVVLINYIEAFVFISILVFISLVIY